MTDPVPPPPLEADPASPFPVGERLVDVCCVLAGMASVVALALVCRLLYPFAIGGVLDKLHLSPEKLVYLGALPVVPVVVVAVRRWLDPRAGRWGGAASALYVALAASCVSVYVAARRLDLTIFLSIPDRVTTYHSSRTLLIAAVLFVLTVAAYVVPAVVRRRLPGTRTVALLVVAATAAWMANFAIIDTEHGYNANALNFSVVMHPVVQVTYGAGLLVDLKTQYGLYAQFLEPVFHLIGGISVFRFSLVMATLLFVSIGSIGWFLVTTIRSRLLALTGFFATLYFHFFAAFLWPYERYYQIYPLRTIVPTLTLVVAYRYFQRPSRTRFLAIVFGLSLGTLWNLDTGLFALTAFVGSAAYAARTQLRPWAARHIVRSMLLWTAGIGASTLVVFLLYVGVRYGAVPHVEWLTAAQSFWLRGVSFPFNHAWTFIATTYIVGLVVALRQAARHRASVHDSALFLVTLLGIGLFTYHLNKGHDSTLSNACYPAVILLTMLVDRSLTLLDERRRSRASVAATKRRWSHVPALAAQHVLAFVALAGIAFLAGAFFVDAHTSQVLRDEVTIEDLWNPLPGDPKAAWPKPGPAPATTAYATVGDLAAVDAPRPRPLWQLKSDYMQRFRLPGGRIRTDMLILSDWDYLLFMSAHARTPSSFVNFRHLFLRSDWDGLFRQLDRRQVPLVMVDEQQGLLKGPKIAHVDPAMDEHLLRVLHANYVERSRVTVGQSFYEGSWYPNDMVLYARR